MMYIIIPVHDRIAATLECLACLSQQTNQAFTTIVVDDGSTDNTADIIKAKYPQVIILTGDGNLWWTGAMALGIDYALTLANDTDTILSLNNDVTFDNHYLEQLVQTSQQYHQAVVGSLCKDVLPPHNVLDAGITMNWYKYQYAQVPYDAAQAVVDQVDTISGRGLLIPVSVIKSIGNFSAKTLPHYGADYDYGFRVKATGLPMVVDNRAVVYLKNDLTGFRPTAKVLSYRDEWRRLFSIKSPANIIVHLKLIWRHCPSLTIKIFDVLYFILGNTYVTVRNTWLYTGSLLKSIFVK